MGITRRNLGRGVVGAVIGAIAYPRGVKAEEEVGPFVQIVWKVKHNPLWRQSRAYINGSEVASFGMWGVESEQKTIQDAIEFYEGCFPGCDIGHIFDEGMRGMI